MIPKITQHMHFPKLSNMQAISIAIHFQVLGLE